MIDLKEVRDPVALAKEEYFCEYGGLVEDWSTGP